MLIVLNSSITFVITFVITLSTKFSIITNLTQFPTFQMLYDYLSQVKFVVEAKLEGGTFEEKYIARFWQKLHVIIHHLL